VVECICAYECGFSEADVVRQLELLEQSGLEEVRRRLPAKADDFQACVCIVWLTLMMSHRSVKRWARSEAVSSSTKDLWQGFISAIVDGW
jgi:hypothetical protein